LRVQDISRQSQTWGTTVPVVHEDDAYRTTMTLLDIPVSDRFRSMLRVYDFDPDATRKVLIRIYATNASAKQPELTPPDRLLTEFPVTLALLNPELQSLHPAYAQVSLSDIPEVRTAETVRIEVVPQSPAMRFWGFVSVTNNETQHVTNIGPR
jgi:hypothetical protein